MRRPRGHGGGREKSTSTSSYIEDWEMGYSIHKLDIDDLDSDARTAISNNKQLGCLPEPCAIPIEASVDGYPADVTAIGSKILFVTDRFSDEAPILIYDTETASLAIGPRPTPALRPLGHIFFVPVDERLYALNPRREDHLQCSFEVISRGPRDEEDEFRLSSGGATLTYMGDARFCLVECAARQGVRWRDASDGEVDGCVLHVTIFGVKYDKRGDLQTTDHRGRSYLVSRYGPVFAAQTFWM
ncbi:unnamed protein product [Miscanthus lutarioriparius]|uniref:Uncharacterized protein n=1 Tax=Miscanthus lutarioriparius TaxID=422564 RepID=A0A811R0H0_9POAL|nr:unnamed protein product [Miscanthus lutarioriparius]